LESLWDKSARGNSTGRLKLTLMGPSLAKLGIRPQREPSADSAYQSGKRHVVQGFLARFQHYNAIYFGSATRPSQVFLNHGFQLRRLGE
jgi:hypothetical protein